MGSGTWPENRPIGRRIKDCHVSIENSAALWFFLRRLDEIRLCYVFTFTIATDLLYLLKKIIDYNISDYFW